MKTFKEYIEKYDELTLNIDPAKWNPASLKDLMTRQGVQLVDTPNKLQSMQQQTKIPTPPQAPTPQAQAPQAPNMAPKPNMGQPLQPNQPTIGQQPNQGQQGQQGKKPVFMNDAQRAAYEAFAKKFGIQ